LGHEKKREKCTATGAMSQPKISILGCEYLFE